MDLEQNASMEVLRKYLKPARVMMLTAGEAGQVFTTKIGGVPWWPAGKPRPHCSHGHPMSFLGQIRLSDVPGFPSDSKKLLSFHYCTQCVYDGEMPFGWDNEGVGGVSDTSFGNTTGYDLTIFDMTESDQPDGLGTISEDIYGAYTVEFVDREDAPSLDEELSIPELPDIPEWARLEYLERLHKGQCVDIDEDDEDEDEDEEEDTLGSFTTEGWQRFKLGGWPEWCQSSYWPVLHPDEEVQFVGQLGPITGEEPWCCGVIYLFMPKDQANGGGARMVIQTS